MDKKKVENVLHDPSQIFQLATAYWGSSVFLTANRLKLFSIIGRHEKTSPEIAKELETAINPIFGKS